MRLIDADKLYPDCMTKNGTLAISQNQIANAPTVEPTYQMPEDYIKNKLDYSRPQGEWIIQPKENSQSAILICNRCNHFIPITVDKNFCPNCGASMKDEVEE